MRRLARERLAHRSWRHFSPLVRTACVTLASAAFGSACCFVVAGVRAPLLRRCGAPAVLTARQVQGALVESEQDGDELEVWQEAYQLELERSELLDESLKLELEKLDGISSELRAEFEGCLVDLEEAPGKPVSSESDKWSEAYLGLRRCNEQMELKINEIRAKASEKEDEEASFTSWTVRMELGPIKYRGIRYKDIEFERYYREGSSFFFVELPMPLGLKLEEREIEGAGKVIQVAELVEGGSAAGDGSIRVGDFLRAITTPQQRMRKDKGEGQGGIAEALGFKEETKAVLVIPRTFPFDKVMEQIGNNKKMDSYVGLAFERPFVKSD